MPDLQRNSCSCRVKARPEKVTFSRFEVQATKAVPCLRLHSEVGHTHSLLSGIRKSVLTLGACFWLLSGFKAVHGTYGSQRDAME